MNANKKQLYEYIFSLTSEQADKLVSFLSYLELLIEESKAESNESGMN